ncbi:MAG: DUF1080 domain-containing protein [Acidobacteria bacterium]|nr:DUF1080 domain-containing protein [Acidobacteriota bacterium]
MKLGIHLLLLIAVVFTAHSVSGQDQWRPLFDGKSLNGWKANFYPESCVVVDGAIRVRSVKDRVHLFYVGDQSDGFERFKNFELEATVRGEPGSNSGIFFHTDFAVRDELKHLANGYEVQLNSSPTEARKTGSLYAVVELDKSLVDETQWFKVSLTVKGKQIVVRLNGQVVVDYTEPDQLVRPPDRVGRKLNPAGGAIALQAHDPGSTFYFKDIRIRPLP